MANEKPERKEARRATIMEMVKGGRLTLKVASEEMGVSYRQGKRIYQKYLKGGEEALVHGNQGKEAHHKTDAEIAEKAVRLYEEKYSDFGPTLAAEELAKRDGIELPVSTLRRLLIDKGLM
jgi:transposase